MQHIVRAYGGDVMVDSTPGAGSKFTITLPLDRMGKARKQLRHETMEDKAVASVNIAVKSQNGKIQQGERDTARILIVEDEPNMVASLRDNFEFEGYQ